MTVTPAPPPPAGSDFIPTRASLLARLRNWDDSRSWNDFFETYWRLIYGCARRAGLSDAEAQETVQETLISVAKGMPEFRYDPGVGSFKTWLHLIVRRRVADQFRKRQRGPAMMEPLPGDEDDLPLDRVADPASIQTDKVWEAEWERNLVAVAAERVKGRVNPAHYQVYEYHVLQGHTVADTARHLQTTQPAVYWIKHRVGRALRKEIERLRQGLI